MIKFAKGGASGKSPVRTPDSLTSTDTVEVLLGISEGPIKGLVDGPKSFRADDTSLLNDNDEPNFQNFGLDVWPGNETGHTIKMELGGFSSPLNIGVALSHNIPVVRSGTVAGIDAADFRVVVQQLYTQNDKGTFKTNLSLKFEVKRTTDAAWQPAWISSTGNILPGDGSGTGSDGGTGGGGGGGGSDLDSFVVMQLASDPIDNGDYLSWRSYGRANNLLSFAGDTQLKLLANSSDVSPPADPTIPAIGLYTTSGVAYARSWEPVAAVWSDYVGDRALFVSPSDGSIPVGQVGDLWHKGSEALVYNGTAWVQGFENASLNPVVNQSGIWTINEKTTAGAPKDLRVFLPDPQPGDIWQYRVTKLTPDTTTDTVTEVQWESVQEINRKPMTIYGVGMARVIGCASDQFTSLPNWNGDWLGRIVKIPSNYNPATRTYTGIWDGTWKIDWTDNAAYIFTDFVENNRYGLSSVFPHIVNKWKIYEWGQHNDTMVLRPDGSLRPRWTYNDYIQQPRDAKELAQYIAGSAGARYVDDGNGIVEVIIDKDDPAIAIFTKENIGDEGFVYSYTDRLTRANEITVEFVNPDLNWQNDKRIVRDADDIAIYGRIPENFIAVGCTDVDEAMARARRRLIGGLTEKEINSFTTNRKGKFLSEWSVILCGDPEMGRGLTGRIRAVTGARSATLRDPLAFEPGITYWASFDVVNPDYPEASSEPFRIERRQITNSAGAGQTTLTFASDLPDLSEYAAFILEAPDVLGFPKPYRITNLSDDSGTGDMIQVTCLELNRNKWDYIDTGVEEEEIIYSSFASGVVMPPVNAKLVSSTRLKGTAATRVLTLSWDKSPSQWVRRYKVFHSINGTPANALDPSGLNIEIEGAEAGTHVFTVVAIDLRGRESLPLSITYNVTGEGRNVPAPTNLRLVGGLTSTHFDDISPLVAWDAAEPSPNFSHYQLQIFDSLSATLLRTEDLGTSFEYRYDFVQNKTDGGGTPRRNLTYRLVSVDQDGNLSIPADIEISNPSPAAPTATLISTFEGFNLQASPPVERDVTGMLVWVSASSGFNPASIEPAYDGDQQLFSIPSPDVGEKFVRVAYYDRFSKSGLNYSAEYLIRTAAQTDAIREIFRDNFGFDEDLVAAEASAAAAAAQAAAAAAAAGVSQAAQANSELAQSMAEDARNLAQAANAGAQSAYAAADVAKLAAQDARDDAIAEALAASGSAGTAAGHASTASSQASVATGAASAATASAVVATARVSEANAAATNQGRAPGQSPSAFARDQWSILDATTDVLSNSRVTVASGALRVTNWSTHIHAKKATAVQAGRRIKAKITYRRATDGGGTDYASGNSVGMFVGGWDASGNETFYGQISEEPIFVSQGVRTVETTVGLAGSGATHTLAAGTVWVRTMARIVSNDGGATDLLTIETVDAESEMAAAGSASASASSASAAAASQTAAASSASASQADRLLAETARGGAESARDTSVASASDAAGSASAASSSASLSVSARDAAQDHAEGAQFWAGNAQSHADASASSASSAAASQSAAGSSASAAETARLAAVAAQGGAEGARGGAETARDASAASAATADGHRAAAQTAASNAANSEYGAGVQAGAATTQAGVATTMAGQASASAASAASSSVTANAAFAAAKAQAIALIPDTISAALWTNNFSTGAPETRPDGSAPLFVNGEYVAPTGSPAVGGPKGLVRWESGRIYELTMQVWGGTGPASKVRFAIDRKDGSYANIAPVYMSATSVASGALVTITLRVGLEVTPVGGVSLARDGANYIGFGVQPNINAALSGGEPGAAQWVSIFKVRDVTALAAAESQASAAVIAASTATAQADLAGTRASAADTARIAAQSAQGGAEVARAGAATSETNAAGSAAAASSAASVSATARDAAVTTAAALLPGDFSKNGLFWSNVLDRSPETMDIATIGGFPTDPATGVVYQVPAGTYVSPKGVFVPLPNRTYEMTLDLQVAFITTPTTRVHLAQFRFLNSSFGYIDDTNTTVTVPISGERVTRKITWNSGANPPPYVRPLLIPWYQGDIDGNNGLMNIRSILVKDVTEQVSAAGSAAASSAAASTASAKATEAGEQAAAATTARDQAQTANASAGVYRDQSAAAASSAAGSEAAAKVSAGIAARVGGGQYVNLQPTFAAGKDGSTGIPVGYLDWTGGSDCTVVAGQVSDKALRWDIPAGVNRGLQVRSDYASTTMPGRPGPGWWVAEAVITLESGSLSGSGMLLQTSTAGVSGEGLAIFFTSETQNNKGVALGAGTIGETYKFSVLFKLNDPGELFVFYMMPSWDQLGPLPAKRLVWHAHGLRRADTSEIETGVARGGFSSVGARISTEEAVRASETASLATRLTKTEAKAVSIPNKLRNSDGSQGASRNWSFVSATAEYDTNVGSFFRLVGSDDKYQISDLIQVNPNSPYNFSFEGEVHSNVSPEYCSLYVSEHDASGNYISSRDGRNYTNFVNLGWFENRKTGEGWVTGPDTHYVKIIFRKLGASIGADVSRIMFCYGTSVPKWTDEATARDVYARTSITESSVADAQAKLAIARLTLIAEATGGRPARMGLYSDSYGGSAIALDAAKIYFGDNTVFDDATDTLQTVWGTTRRVIAWGAPFGSDNLTEWEGAHDVALSSMTMANARFWRSSVSPYAGGPAFATAPVFSVKASAVQRVKVQVGGSGTITTDSVALTPVNAPSGSVTYAWTKVFGQDEINVSSSTGSTVTFNANPPSGTATQYQTIWAWSVTASDGQVRTGQVFVTIIRDI